MEEDESLELSVFPSRERRRYCIGTAIDTAELRDYVRTILRPSFKIHYVVHINLQFPTRKASLDEKRSIELALEEALNNASVFSPSILLTSTLRNSRIVIMPRPRDIAIHYFPAQRLPTDYTIKVFNGTRESARRLENYNTAVKTYNDTKLAEPLLLIEPIRLEDLLSPDRIVFLAERDSLIIGFCACTILPYNEAAPQRLTSKDLSLFFNKTQPSHAFEIEAISVSQLERRKNVGLLLFREAMRFIITPAIHETYYPVSHIVARSASFVTKLLLNSNFNFAYYGTNEFLNENFVETLRPDTQQRFLRCISDALEYYVSLLRDTPKALFKTQEATLMLNLYKTVIHLYQLFFLFIKYTPPYPTVTDTITTQLIALFGDLAFILKNESRAKKTLSIYFSENQQKLTLYSQDRLLSHFEGSIYTALSVEDVLNDKVLASMGYRLNSQFRTLGFLKGAVEEKERKKLYKEGYEILFMAVANITEIDESSSLVGKERDESAQLLFDAINELLSVDLIRSSNYELPYPPSVKPQPLPLTQIILSLNLPGRKKKIASTLGLLHDKARLVQLNYEDLNYLAYQNYDIPVSNMALDTFLSYEELATEWPNIDNKILSKVNQAVLSVVGKKEKEEVYRGRVFFLSIPLPIDREALFRDIYTLRDIFALDLGNDTCVAVNNSYFKVGVLRKHHLRLMTMRDTFQVEEEQQEMVVEQTMSVPSYIYTLGDFIEREELDPLVEVFYENNVMNRDSI